MAQIKMHVDEVETDVALVRRLLTAQFPQWASLPIKPVPSAGTDNALYRLGDALVVRLPRIHWAITQVEKEQEWLPQLAPHLPCEIPAPLAQGEPTDDYPYTWSIYRWLKGENPTLGQIENPQALATDLAHFVTALHRIDPTAGVRAGLQNSSRSVPLAARDKSVNEAIAALGNQIDVGPVTAAWQTALQAPVWNQPPVWFHGDLQSGNVLLQEGRLSAVIDFGCLGVGDPAVDMMAAWTLFDETGRTAFRAALAVDEATWVRGRGWALSFALIALPYYLPTNPTIVNIARRTIDQVLSDISFNPIARFPYG